LLGPTPIHPLKNLSRYLNGPEIWIKRDDLTGALAELSGNKVRKLEYHFGALQERNLDVFITEGVTSSNHCRQASAAANRLGVRCGLIIKGSPETEDEGNLPLYQLYGADLHWSGDQTRADIREAVFKSYQDKGLSYLHTPTGGSDVLGALGYINAAKEIKEQEGQLGLVFDHYVHCTGSGGTEVGMTLGIETQGLTPSQHSVMIETHIDDQCIKEMTNALLEKSREAFGIPTPQLSPCQRHNYVGEGYGELTEKEVEATATFLALESIDLDPVYMAGVGAFMLDACRNGLFAKSDKVLMIHTGGQSVFFNKKYKQDLVPRLVKKAAEIRASLA